MLTEETKKGKTPNGGVKSTIRYLDDDMQPIDKEQATQAIIIEYDENDEEIQRTYGILGGDENG